MVEEARAAGATPVLMTIATHLELAPEEEPEEGSLAKACGGPLPEEPVARRPTPEATPPPLARHVAGSADRAAEQHDSFAVDEWLGWNDDRGFLQVRDCWRYVNMRRALDEKITARKASPEELLWAANGYALEPGGDARARALYAQARAAK